MDTTFTYFTKQGIISDPGKYAYLFDGLPTSLPELVQVVQSSTVHIFWAERYGLKLSPEREAEVQLRTMPRRLQRMLEVDPRPLDQPRPLEKKVVGNCRDFTLLVVSLLRHQGTPARARLMIAATVSLACAP